VEVENHGLLFAARQFSVISWAGQVDSREQLYFADLFQPLLKLTVCADRFYAAQGYFGNLTIKTSSHHVLRQAMRFIPAPDIFGDDPEDFRCYTDMVPAERLVTVEQIRSQKVQVLTDILAELTWAFWQSYSAYPLDRLRQDVQRHIQQLGA
jgi:hypothetical protein